MSCVGVGVSSESNPEAAVAEVLNSAIKEVNLTQIHWVLIFFTPDHFVHAGRLHELILEQTKCECIAGCSGMGVITGEGEITQGPGLVLMAGFTPELHLKALAKYQELEHSAGVTQQLREELENFGDEKSLFLFFPDVYQHQPNNFINMFNYLKSSPSVYGGGSCNDGNQETSIQFGPNIVTLNGAGGLAMAGMTDFVAGVTQSCATLGEPMFVTETKDDLILSLDGKPALEVFTEIAKEFEFRDMEQAAEQLLLSFPLDPEKPLFTGETGAGKSILLDSISLALGSRGNINLIGPYSKKLEVVAVFEINSDHIIHQYLSDNDYSFEGSSLILRRVLRKDGKSSAYINDNQVSISFLKKVGETLVEILGQFESHGLINEKTHIHFLDK